MDAGTLAAQGIAALEELLVASPPAVVTARDVGRFFSRHRSALESHLRTLLERIAEPASQRLDREWRGRWHLLNRETLWTELDKARRQETSTVDWRLTRIWVHRPDLLRAGEDWARSNQLPMPAAIPIQQPMPADDAGSLLVYDITAAEAPRLNVLPKETGFPRFAELAYVNDDQPAGVLLDIAAGYFGRPVAAGLNNANEPLDPIRLDQLGLAIAEASPGLSQSEIAERAISALSARRQLLYAAGLTPKPATPLIQKTGPMPVDKDNAPTPEELLEALGSAQDLRSAAERTAANIRAIRVLDRPHSDQKQNWRELMGYSGWGGLSIDEVRDVLPQRWTPETSSLVHEYYTPSSVALAIARVLRPWVPALPRTADGFVMAIEPSAGIGRLLNAASTPGFESLSWSVIEYSQVSASLLQSIRPDLHIVKSSFEEWVQQYEPMVSGKVGLVLSNPPYGERGGTYTLDKNKAYRENKAYVYFLRRGLDLLAEGGVGVFLVPYGFMTGTSAAFVRLRETVLKRHHLRAAFRLPSGLFPGALLVTDLLFFESRGGELPTVLSEDQYIAEGKYFTRHPQHILGKEVGVSGDEDDTTAKPRWGYQVEGVFEGLPDFEPRLRCLTCTVSPVRTAQVPRAALAARKQFDELPLHVQAASVLGDRVRRYLELFTSGDHASIGRAAALQPELLEALRAWTDNLGRPRNPWQDQEIMLAAKSSPQVVSFLSGFDETGGVIPQIATKPSWAPRYEGSNDDLVAQAEWLYSIKRELTVESLKGFRESLGIFNLEPLHTQLIAGGWCYDDGRWMPERDYYSGLLWDRYERARQGAQQGDTQAAAQLARLAALIQVSRIDQIDPEPRMPWIPLDILKRWLEQWTGRAVAALAWRDSILQLAESSYQELPKKATSWQVVAIGYINHDLEFFKPPYTKSIDPNTGEEETAEQALDRARIQYSVKAKQSFKDFVLGDADSATQIEAAYNRMFRGYIMPQYGSEEIQIARWTGRIRLKPHQNAGARRLIANNGGLLGFDVGVGKTFTGIATIARLRQEGRARRPIVLVPNTIIWKWHKEFRAALPDYRILVVGSNRYIGRGGLYVSKIDTPEERALKWRQFQAGEYDVALVTYSVFARTQIRATTLREWVYETPVLLRKLSLDSRELAQKIDAGSEGVKKAKPRVSDRAIEKLIGPERFKQLSQREREQLVDQLAEQKTKEKQAELDKLLAIVSAYSDLSERQRAVFGEALDRWIAVRLENHNAPDPGIFFEDLGCDALLVDEAQNFKNLWPVSQREGGIPKYLGAISEGSDRAYALAIRAHLVRQRNGGSGVFLLSATPAKNSPLEYFTLLGYVDSAAWSRLGISDPEVFIDRYLRLETREIVAPDMSIVKRGVVAGFKNLDELRSVIFRFAEFRTAEEVGLVLPKPEISQITVPMDERQEAKYAVYATKYRDALKRSKDDPKMRLKALGMLQRMALTAIHPELDEGPRAGQDADDADAMGLPEDRTGWTWGNSTQVSNPACPKLTHVQNMILDRPDCGHLVFCDNVAVHRWLKMLLVAAGYPEERIAAFNADQAKDPAKRQSIAERFNGSPAIVGDDGVIEQEAVPPEFDVVIANATAYEGIDLHIRTCQVYHIDLPWEPATLQQRNGRAVRQGNTQAVIGIVYLLSDRSLDAVRLSMIIGKLGWMKDVLSSADRETNNPAAQNELSADEMVLFLARDPEEAKAAIAEQKKLLELEQRKRVQEQAWNALRGMITRVSVLARISDPAERQAVQTEIASQVDRLNQIPTTVWSWHFLIAPVQEGKPILIGPDGSGGFWGLLADSYVAINDKREGLRGFATGKIEGDSIGIRQLGQPSFNKYQRDQISADTSLIAVTAEAVEQGPRRWNHEEDQARFKEGLAQVLEWVANGNWKNLGLEFASATWRKYLLSEWWDKIVEVIKLAGREPMLPVKAGADALSIELPADVKDFADVIPFDPDLWGEFVRRAMGSEERYTDLNATSMAWWGRPFPKGILRRPSELAEISVQTASGREKVKALLVEGPLAVNFEFGRGLDHPDGARYSVTHVPSGFSVMQGFKSEAVATAALRYARGQPIDWSTEKPDGAALNPKFIPTMTWLREQVSVPSDEEIRRYATKE